MSQPGAVTEASMESIARSVCLSLQTLMKSSMASPNGAHKLFNLHHDATVANWNIRTYAVTPEGQATPEDRALKAVFHPWVIRDRVDVQDSVGAGRVVEYGFAGSEAWWSQRRLFLKMSIYVPGPSAGHPPKRIRHLELDIYFRGGAATGEDPTLEALQLMVDQLKDFFEWKRQPDLTHVSPRFSVVVNGNYDVLGQVNASTDLA